MTHFPIHNSELWLVCIAPSAKRRGRRGGDENNQNKELQQEQIYIWNCTITPLSGSVWLHLETISTNFWIIAEDESADYIRSVSQFTYSLGNLFKFNLRCIFTLHRFFGPTNRLVTLKLIRYSLLMLFIPLATFYFMFFVVFNGDKDMLAWCGGAAVISANLVVVSYVFMAWNEDKDENSKTKKYKEGKYYRERID
jgi:hypothetical protein